MTDDEILLLLGIVVCPSTSSATYESEIAKDLVKLLMSLVTTQHESLSGKGSKTILNNLTESINQWASSPAQSLLTNLICILALRFGTLPTLISKVVSLVVSENSNQNLNDCIQSMFLFVATLRNTVHCEVDDSALEATAQLNREGNSGPRKGIQRRTCTFTQTGEGFAEQHWYNCYTCGLLKDKGCCSLCARVCHKDHDVGYSRKSSFFCDCGAEVASGARVKCKCLSPIDEATFNSLHNESVLAEEPKQLDCGNPVQMVYHSYPAECLSTLDLLAKEAKVSKWNETMLSLFNHSFTNDSIDFNISYLIEDTPAISTIETGKPGLEIRCGLPLNLKLLDGNQSMLPVRAAKANSLKMGMISLSSAIHMRRNRAGRQLIDSDTRGRMVCAEANSILFFSAIPSVNTRHLDTSYAMHLSRSQLSFLGTEKVKFDVLGLALSENQNLLAFWGGSEACVAVLSKGFDAIERTVTLALQIESDSGECESEYLVGLLWLTETIIVGICGTVVHVFDLATTDSEDSCKGTAHFALAYEDVLIRSAVLTSNLSPSHSKEVYKKLVMLLDTGRIHSIDLCVDHDGALEEEGETYIEIGSGITFASAGIRRYYGGEPGSAGSTSTTFGEGATLHFLQHSNLLLYQCVSSPVVAMLIDKNGTINGTFELLPSTISSDNLPGCNFGVLTGPYVHFQELGTVRRDGEVFFRVSCVARVPSSNQQRILLLEFNQSSSVSVKELCWPPSFSAGLGTFSASNSFVGSCTFSVPHLVGGLSSQGSIDGNTEVHERAFLTMLSSNGSILWFGEDMDPSKQAEPPIAENASASNNIFMFEEPSIMNVSEEDWLIFAGDCAGKDFKTIKKKLSLNNSEFLTSPSREGCTLTARLDSGIAKKSGKTNVEDLAIVTVRVLVGGVPELIPREISIMGTGRTIKTKRNLWRWYDFVLTDEEILLAVRNGFVTIHFSSSHDMTSGAAVDAVEIYAKKRSEIPCLTSKSNSAPASDCNFKWQRNNKQGEQNQVSCIKSLTALAKILGEDKASLFGTGSREVIRQILEKTALDTCDDESTESLRTSTLSLLKQVEDSESQRSLFIDHSTLRGLMSTLLNLGKFIKSEVSTIGVGTAFSKQESMIRRAVDLLVHIVNNSSNIARANGNNYKDAILSMMNDGVSTTSLAIEAKRILDFTTHLSLVYGSTINFVKSTYHISQLILMEMSCADSNSFAQFDTLSEYLLHDDSSIVESCCKAIMSTCTDASKPKVPAVDKLTQDNPNNGYVTYQCDACKMFPIKDKRYTIGGEVDIDLCQDCFERGCTYATSHEPGSPLIIHGRTLTVEDEDMPCDSIWQMKCIAIAAPTAGFPMVEDVEVALKMSQTTKEHASNNQGADKDEFRSSLFSNLLSLVSKSLAKSSTPSPHLIHLVLGLVHGSKNEKSRIAKGKEMLKSITGSLQDLLQADNVQAGKIVLVLRTISSLVTKKTTIEPSPSSALVKSIPKDKEGKGHQHKSKADPRFICDTHKVPAVRRRCSHGVHKDRRFYVCGLERKHRCNYFKWADSPDNRPEVEDHLSKFGSNNQNISEPLQIELTTILSSFQLQFCTLIGQQFELLKDTSPDDSGDTNIVTERPNFFLRSNDDINQDLNDGILESRIKLGKVETRSATSSSCSSAETSSNGIASLISESLYLLTLVASPPKWGQDWYPVLCAIITGGSSVLRHLAKKFLQKLCGGRQEVYHRIRDHFVYGYLFRKLLCQSEEVLDNALIVREMAKQCGVSWRDDEVEFKTLHPAGLFGVGDLISEDCLSVSYERTVQQILDELLSTAGTNARRCNWKNFCALSEIPPDNKTSTLSHGDTNILEQLVHRPPIMSILWLSSCLRGSNQVKMLKLADIALIEIKKEDHSSSTDEDDAKIGDESNNESLQMTPERTLSALGIGDVHAFIVEFVVHGKSKEVRLVAGQVAAKLATPFTDSDKNALVSRLIDGLLRHVAEKFGCVSQELIELLRHYVKSFNLDLSNIASCISSAFVLQMKTANDCITRSASSASSADIKFDLANCVHCHRQATTTKETEVWNDEQLRPCVKTRLESSTLSSASSEYSSYVQLKFRVVLSEVHLTVSDPRGRLVKSIGIYFSPRPFEDVSMLKNDKYSNIWQRCGTLSLARHATSASFKLKSPVVAANLKFTYEEFYEKVGGGSSRASDGSFILHCPQCTRQVNNAHGVCGNCGEVAFQCRKCRHINYDRLDAFLCVECGYCTSGGFSYDISVGMALNAVAILDEDGYQRSVSMLRIASKRHSELRNSLKKKVLASSQQQSKLNGQDECIEEMVLYGPHLNRAFMGRLPKMNDESESKPPSSQPGSSTARQGDSTRSLASNRARSLISLARQLRSESAGVSGDGERLSRSELLQQVLLSTGNSGLSSDVLDELNETMFGALGGSSTDHSLNRAIACLQDRNQPRTSREIGGASGEDAARAAAKDDKKSTPMGESSRIYSQMREAERECYELTRRIEAWNRLNEDALATLGSRNPFRSSFVFRPTSCSNCSPQIALSLLSLLSTVYETSISQSESTVTPELIKLLVSESVGMNAELKNMKRQLLITLASTSEYASNFILAKLKAMQDVTSAELLGQIIQLDFPSCGDYIDFAVSVLQGSEN